MALVSAIEGKRRQRRSKERLKEKEEKKKERPCGTIEPKEGQKGGDLLKTGTGIGSDGSCG